MEPGDTVRVRTSGRTARIVSALSRDRYQVEFLPDAAGDALDRDTVQSEQEEGVYAGNELDLVE
jgi:hypothetical protein